MHFPSHYFFPGLVQSGMFVYAEEGSRWKSGARTGGRTTALLMQVPQTQRRATFLISL